MNAQEERMDWVLKVLRRRGARLTGARLAIVRSLAEARGPVSIRHLSLCPGVRGECDPATIYRTVMCLVEHRAARELHLTNRSSHFVLASPESAHDYLICETCGRVTELPCDAELHALEQRLARDRGFAAQRHQFHIYGLCEGCRIGAGDAANEGRMRPVCVCCQAEPWLGEINLSL